MFANPLICDLYVGFVRLNICGIVFTLAVVAVQCVLRAKLATIFAYPMGAAAYVCAVKFSTFFCSCVCVILLCNVYTVVCCIIDSFCCKYHGELPTIRYITFCGVSLISVLKSFFVHVSLLLVLNSLVLFS